MEQKLKTPVAFFIFNRPEKTRRVFEKIREAKPEKLFIIADSHRNEEERGICEETKKITENIDWSCEVKRNYSEKNLGCKSRLSSGIDWVFQSVDKAIFLEDDCLPNKTFFRFCEEMLEKYIDNNKVVHISGVNFQQENPKFKCNESYYFSQIPQIWGWATWKRAWKFYDVSLEQWPRERKNNLLKKIFTEKSDYAIREHWDYLFSIMYEEANTWDPQWVFACFQNEGLSINPCINLITNIGSGINATHNTKDSNLNNVANEEIIFPLKHPEEIKINKKADEFSYKRVWGINHNLFQKIISFSKFYLPLPYKTTRWLYRKIKNLS